MTVADCHAVVASQSTARAAVAALAEAVIGLPQARFTTSAEEAAEAGPVPVDRTAAASEARIAAFVAKSAVAARETAVRTAALRCVGMVTEALRGRSGRRSGAVERSGTRAWGVTARVDLKSSLFGQFRSIW
ncbi:hypothetical protein Ssi03_07430 [Sphaerisporangium siamense]|nr:hypothetical protein Ssi03_07430 [Sphaerisporangium siamense]